MSSEKRRLGELLLDAKLITEEQLTAALKHQSQWGGRIGTVVVNLGYLTEEQVLAYLRNHFRVPSINLKRLAIQEDVINLVPAELAKKHLLIPVGKKTIKGKDNLVVAMSNPSDIQAIDELRFAVNMPIQPALSLDFIIEQAISHYYDKAGGFFEEQPLGGQAEGEGVTGIITNQKDLHAQYYPSEVKELTEEEKAEKKAAEALEAADNSEAPAASELASLVKVQEFNALARLLIAKGVISEDEWDQAISKA